MAPAPHERDEIGMLIEQFNLENVDALFLDDLSSNGIAEVYSLPRTAAMDHEFGLQQGWSDSNLTDDAVVARASAATGSLFAEDLWET